MIKERAAPYCYLGVRTLTDEELQTISAEIEKSCQHWSGDDEYWTDDHAEATYYEMQRETRRRWEERNPEEAAYYRMEQRAASVRCAAVFTK